MSENMETQMESLVLLFRLRFAQLGTLGRFSTAKFQGKF